MVVAIRSGERVGAASGDGGGERFPLTVTLSLKEIALAAFLGGFMKARAITGKYRNRAGPAGPSDWNIQIEGIAAEIAVAKALGVPYRPSLGFKVPDVASVYVRHTDRPGGSLIIRPGDPDGVYVLAIGQCPVFRIVGWIHSYDAKRPQYWRAPNGGPGAWFVPQSMLKRYLKTTALRRAVSEALEPSGRDSWAPPLSP